MNVKWACRKKKNPPNLCFLPHNVCQCHFQTLCQLNNLRTQNFTSCNFVLGTLRSRDQIALDCIEEVPPHLSIRELGEGMVGDLTNPEGTSKKPIVKVGLLALWQ